jgi:biotin carboxyl carrier protein
MSSTSMTIEIDGQRFICQPEAWHQLDAIALDDTHFHVLENGKRHLIEVLEFDLHNRTCLLNVDGEVKRATLIRELDLQIERMGLNAVQEAILKSLDAPMPGLVTQIHVQPGDSVEKGTPLVILEAMKMENVITAPHAAVIKAVHVQKGQAVEKGGTMIEFA